MIRPATAADAIAIGELHARVWKQSGSDDGAESTPFAEHFRTVYLDGPFYDADSPPLVHEDADGRVTGMLCAVVRPMRFRGRRIKVAITSEFAVDPHARASLTAVQLSRQFINGPQDLTVCDRTNDRSRKLFVGLGGVAPPLYCLHWVRPLRICRLAARMLARRRTLRPGAVLARPLAAVFDAALARTPGNPLRPPAVNGPARPLCADDLLQLGSLTQSDDLHPDYDSAAAEWVWQRLGTMQRASQIHSSAFTSSTGSLEGWFVYRLHNRVAETLQLAAVDGAFHRVLDHLVQHAHGEGADCVTGRVQPRHLAAFSDRYCFFHRRGDLTVVHSRDPALTDSFARGDAYLSLLDGEAALAHIT